MSSASRPVPAVAPPANGGQASPHLSLHVGVVTPWSGVNMYSVKPPLVSTSPSEVVLTSIASPPTTPVVAAPPAVVAGAFVVAAAAVVAGAFVVAAAAVVAGAAAVV